MEYCLGGDLRKVCYSYTHAPWLRLRTQMRTRSPATTSTERSNRKKYTIGTRWNPITPALRLDALQVTMEDLAVICPTITLHQMNSMQCICTLPQKECQAAHEGPRPSPICILPERSTDNAISIAFHTALSHVYEHGGLQTWLSYSSSVRRNGPKFPQLIVGRLSKTFDPS